MNKQIEVWRVGHKDIAWACTRRLILRRTWYLHLLVPRRASIDILWTSSSSYYYLLVASFPGVTVIRGSYNCNFKDNGKP